ncbi:MFP1 attachment factor 1-like [Neltuma alba]|uniref:MFP1 attachment factor 1-like n=1 Tax=Neltuma alba TaxID=207710 RepID=UPI0010A4B14F|nr:MFP1 attachment factor 1-like [Prosopis alba]
MSDSEITNTASAPEQGSTEARSQGNQDQAAAKPDRPGGISFSIWPPTQRTRDAVVNRLIETLSTPSVLSKRYGTMLPDEASSVARQIEEEAFTAAGGSASAEDDGIEILQVYSKEISKRMLDTVKARSTSASQPASSEVPPSPATEATSGAESHS